MYFDAEGILPNGVKIFGFLYTEGKLFLFCMRTLPKITSTLTNSLHKYTKTTDYMYNTCMLITRHNYKKVEKLVQFSLHFA